MEDMKIEEMKNIYYTREPINKKVDSVGGGSVFSIS